MYIIIVFLELIFQIGRPILIEQANTVSDNCIKKYDVVSQRRIRETSDVDGGFVQKVH
jgi:hypothetical protein